MVLGTICQLDQLEERVLSNANDLALDFHLSPREIETSRALNERDYLAQTFIKVNTRALGDLPPGFKDLALAEEDLADREDGRIYSRALVWFKGVEVERRRGRRGRR